ncbi:peroxisome assembly protein 10-A-like [Ornithodoros turicata]|uniref:peroxisome assembly protein 10-A-like n=1 Tax=Ornithodoros turicata TaxID=34597 RepID=UPI003138C529
MAPFNPALQPEILRAFQKDEQHITVLQKQVSEVSRLIFGIPWWIRWKSDVEALSKLLYFLATTLSGLQTLGEEYVHVLQVTSSLNEIPSFVQRLAAALLQTFGSRIVGKIVNSARTAGCDHNSTLENAFEKFSRLHLTLFYLFGAYYTPAKRITGIRHVLLRKWMANANGSYYYKILGWLSLAELAVSIACDLRAVKLRQASCNSPTTKVSTKYGCSMCMGPTKDTTLIPCGHVYCWFCIAEWLSTNPGCPLCRTACKPQEMCVLNNVK